MKPAALILALLLALLLASCAPAPQAWQGKPDPLDTPPVEVTEPTANGHFGPFGTAPLEHRSFTGSP